MIFKKIFALLALIFVMNTWAVVAEFKYFTRLPQGTLSCEQQALNLAKRFERITHLTTTSSRCLGEGDFNNNEQDFHFHLVEISYRAIKEIIPYDAIYGSSNSLHIPSTNRGAFSTYSECLSDITAQENLFQKETGLEIFVSTCLKAASPYGTPFVMKISGIGNPSKMLFADEMQFYSDLDSDFKEQLLSLYRINGATIARENNLHILYYAKSRLRIMHNHVAGFSIRSQCESQVSIFRSILMKYGARNAVVKCLPISHISGRFSLEAVYDANEFLGSDFVVNAPLYYSYEECINAREGFLLDYARRGGKPLGGICHETRMDHSQFELEIYSNIL